MRHDECLLLLSRTGKMIWAKKPATAWLGCTLGGLIEMAIPMTVGGVGVVADWLGSMGKAFRTAAAGAVSEVEGDAWFPDKANPETVFQWKFSTLPIASQDFRVLLSISESPSASSADASSGGARDAVEDSGERGFRLSAEGRVGDVMPAEARLFVHGSPSEMVGKMNEPGAGIFAIPDRMADFLSLLGRIGFVEGFKLAVLKADKTVFCGLGSLWIRLRFGIQPARRFSLNVVWPT